MINKELKFILNCAMRTNSIHSVDYALVGLHYMHPQTFHRLTEWSIFNRSNLTYREVLKLLKLNAVFYMWLQKQLLQLNSAWIIHLRLIVENLL